MRNINVMRYHTPPNRAHQGGWVQSRSCNKHKYISKKMARRLPSESEICKDGVINFIFSRTYIYMYRPLPTYAKPTFTSLKYRYLEIHIRLRTQDLRYSGVTGTPNLLSCGSFRPLFNCIISSPYWVPENWPCGHYYCCYCYFYFRHYCCNCYCWYLYSLLTYLFTELSPSWGAVNCAAPQVPHSISWNPKVQYRVHKSPPLVPILSHINPIQSIPYYLSKIHFISV
jgi:hypothetical protein